MGENLEEGGHSGILGTLRENLWRFLRPLGPKPPKPGTTGMAAIKKTMLKEHGPTSLADQQRQNTERLNKGKV
jgi:hypothetical protein